MGASAGRVLLIPKGDWNASTTYTGLDWVRHNGAAWVCKNTCTNIEPTEANSANWQMMARDGDGVTADTAMSDTSTNAVQNKVIKSYVDNSIAGISDMTGATSTENGTHGLVPAPQIGDEKKVLLGDGTWGAIDDKFSFSDHDTATSGTSFTDAEDGNMIVTDWTKNLLKPTLKTTTNNGVTFTNNGDGTYTLNGTVNKNSTLTFVSRDNSRNFIKKFIGKKLKFIYIINEAEQLGKSYMCIGQSLSEDWVKWGHQIDNGKSKPICDNIVGIVCDLHMFAGDIFNNVLIKPMLTTDLSATYDDFVPYGGYKIKSCGKNLLNVKSITDNQLAENISVTIENGSTFILNGKYELNHVRDIYFDMSSGTILLKKNKKYIFSANGIVDNINIMFRKVGTYYIYVTLDTENTKYIITPDKDLLLYFNINFPGQVDVSNLRINVQIEEVSLDTTEPTDFEPYTGETITVTNDTELPAFGLKSHKGITHIISPGNVKCVYPTNESGKGVLDAMYNNELSKLKNAILTYKTKEEYDAAVANDKIPDGATVIKDYDD